MLVDRLRDQLKQSSSREAGAVAMTRISNDLGAAERAGNALHSARVCVELGSRLAHAHSARQSRPDTLSQPFRDRRPAGTTAATFGIDHRENARVKADA
jgi:hypothetical protein